MLRQEVKSLKKAYNEQQDMIQTQKINIDSLNNMIFKKDITIGTNEKNMKELKEELSLKKKDLKKNESLFNEKLIIIDNLNLLTAKNSKKITDLTENLYSLIKKYEDLEKKYENLDNKINLIGCQDFLRKIFSDFCFIFSYVHHGKYNETARNLVDQIKKEGNKSPLKQFAQKVNLIEFLDYLAKIIEESDDLPHFVFKELSIEFRNQVISQITNEEIIKENITKCKNAFNDYCKINFDYIFSFFINECNYPNYIFNKLEISKYNFLKTIKNYNDKH